MTEVAVVVPTYRRVDSLRRLIQALEAQTLSPDRWELVIVDDASGPDLSPRIDQLALRSHLRIRVIHSPRNRGQAAARNFGWRSTTTPLLAFTDDDCTPRPRWLEAGVDHMNSSPDVGIAQGPTVRPNEGGYRYTIWTEAREVLAPSPWFEGCNLFVRRDALDATGGFDEVLSDFAEDTALGWAVLDAGWSRGWAEDAVVEHELSERSWRWHLRFYFLQGRIVDVAARYPQIREMFWRPWAVGAENAYFALAVAGVGLARKRTGAMALTLPYLVWLFGPPERRPSFGAAARVGVFKVSTSAASFAGKALGAARNKTFLL